MKKTICLFSTILLIIVLTFSLMSCGKIRSVDYTLSFESDGNVVHTISTQGDEEVVLPANPVKEGYVFEGWYWDNGTWLRPFTASSLVNEPLKSDMTVYAKFISEEELNAEYTVTYDSKGGTDVTETVTGYDTLISEPIAPTKSNYDFGGWFTDAACTKEWNFSTDKVTKDITLYAKWAEVSPDARTYSVVFFSNGGTEIATYTDVTYNTTITEPAAPEKVGNTFQGWYTSEAYTTRWSFATDKVTRDINLYAKWQPVNAKSTVVFNSNGGSAIESLVGGTVIGMGETAPRLPPRIILLFGATLVNNQTKIIYKGGK